MHQPGPMRTVQLDSSHRMASRPHHVEPTGATSSSYPLAEAAVRAGAQVLEELAITVQAQLGDRLPLPFCAFNGGADVFVDLGNKSLGLEVRV